MSECTDKRLANLIYAYELDLLTDEERQEFELHLYECDQCFELVQRFRPAISQLRDNPGVREAISSLAEEDVSVRSIAEAEPQRGTTRGPFWFRLVPASLAAAAVLVILLLKPFSIEIKSTQEALAIENRLMVIQFENLADSTDSARLGAVIANLVITDLYESRYIEVVSQQRLTDIMNLIDHQDRETAAKSRASQLAREARARWILTGSILQQEPSLVVTSQLADAGSGEVLASQQVRGAPGEDVFDVVDRLTIAVKNDLSLPPEAFQEVDPSVADVTTHSAEAYRYYLEGRKEYNRFFYPEAAVNFERAVEYDSTFAMAWYYLARLRGRSHLENAVRYSDRASWREQRYIRSLELSAGGDVPAAIAELQQILSRFPEEKDALLYIGNYCYFEQEYTEALGFLSQVLEIDPLHQVATNMLAYTHYRLGDYDQALATIDRYIEMAPGEPNPYDTRGDIHHLNDNLEEAVRSYEEALRVRPGFLASLQKVSYLYVFTGQYEKADSAMKVLASSHDDEARCSGKFYQAMIPLYQGKFREALSVLDDNIAAFRLEHDYEPYASYRHMKSIIYQQRGMLDSAIAEGRRSVELYLKNHPETIDADRPTLIWALAEAGEFAEAEQSAIELKADLDSIGRRLTRYWFSIGAMEFYRGNIERSIERLQLAAGDSTVYWVDAHYLLALAYREAGQLDSAAAGFTQLASLTGERALYQCLMIVKSHYHLGITYEQMGETAKAISKYREFLKIWVTADPGTKEVEDASRRLELLQAQS